MVRQGSGSQSGDTGRALMQQPRLPPGPAPERPPARGLAGVLACEMHLLRAGRRIMGIELRILITGFIAFLGLTIIAAGGGDKKPKPSHEPAFAAGTVSEVGPGPKVAGRRNKADAGPAGHRAKALAALRAKR